MVTPNHKNVPCPEPGDDILTTFRNAFDHAGIIIPTQSIPAARALLTQAEQDNIPATPVHPWYFDIEGIIYRNDGSKKDDKHVLKPLNEIEIEETTYNQQWASSLKANEYSAMMISKLPARPYPRQAIITATAWIANDEGTLSFAIQAHHSRYLLGRVALGEDHTVTLTHQVTIPAGFTPAISAGVHGGWKGGRGRLTRDTSFNLLSVTAFPITAA